ncbi:MAG: hypothetical protein UY35_C0022G0003 [Candidatus Saccharibacteria bacterium GW2011_GWC2_48_9]|nr:MAG: hypothetical protein UY35_C0022G0003 [Candidatus Saccharibacteria bacterium GW2011_GWC2_48_9]
MLMLDIVKTQDYDEVTTRHGGIPGGIYNQ